MSMKKFKLKINVNQKKTAEPVNKMTNSTSDFMFMTQAYVQFILGWIILIANLIILLSFIKYKKDTWTFISYCVLEYLIYNNLFAISCLFSIATIFTDLENIYLCMIPLSFREFIILSTYKVNFSLALARLYQIKKNTCFNPRPVQFWLEKLILPILLLLFTLIPIFTGWNNYSQFQLRCLYKRVMPSVFIGIINSVTVFLAACTIGFYAYIYMFCKNKMSTVSDLQRRESISSGDSCQQKLKVLRFQIGIFLMLFVLSLPNLILSYYEAIAKIKLQFYSTIFNFWILVDYMTRPVIYIYRLKHMKTMNGRDSNIPF